jgi:hypothetical protein
MVNSGLGTIGGCYLYEEESQRGHRNVQSQVPNRIEDPLNI